MNKKGIELSLTAIVGLVLAIIVIGSTAYAFIKIGGIFFPRKDPFMTNFEKLTSDVQALLDSDEMTKMVAYNIDKRHALVGFDKEDTVDENCAKQSKFTRPEDCSGKPCLCFCKIEYPGRAKECVECRVFENVSYFYTLSTFDKDNNNVGKERPGLGNYLVIFGQCYTKKFEVKNLKITKQPKGDKFNIIFDVLD